MKRIIFITVMLLGALVINTNAFASDITVNNTGTAETTWSCNGPDCDKVNARGGSMSSDILPEKNTNVDTMDSSSGEIPEKFNTLSTRTTSIMINPNIAIEVARVGIKHNCSVSEKEVRKMVSDSFNSYIGNSEVIIIELSTTEIEPTYSSSPDSIGYIIARYLSAGGNLADGRCMTTATAYSKK